jgi:hypothetical protein
VPHCSQNEAAASNAVILSRPLFCTRAVIVMSS